MSRTITQSDTLTFHPTSFDDDNSQYASINSSYPISRALDGSDSTYARINITTGSRATTYLYFDFDTSAIPDGSTITSVSCTAKAALSSTNSSRITTREIQMCTGTTTKGSSTNIGTSTNTITLSVGSWTLAELRNASVRCYIVRGTSNTTSTYYVSFYNATLTVAYEFEGTMYEITTSSQTDAATISPASEEVMQNEDYKAIIDTADVSTIVVTDNGTDVTSQLVQKEVEPGGTKTAVPASYQTSGNISGTRYQSAIGNGSDADDSSGNDYCSSSGSTAHIDYSFGTIEIPSEATITSVTCVVKGHCESTSNSSEVAECALYSGSTRLSDAIEFESTYDTTITLDAGAIDESELEDLVLRFTIGYYGGQVSGATLSVTYTMPQTSNPYYYEYTITNMSADHVIIVADKTCIFIKKNGTWQKYTKAYRKVNGQWQQIDDLTTVFSSSGNYICGD